MARVTIGIASYNGGERLDHLLRSIFLRTPEIGPNGDLEIVVVDDGSPRVEETRVTIKKWLNKLPLLYVEHGRNRGISAGWNTATREGSGEIVILANDDVIVSLWWLTALTYVLDHSSQVGGVGLNWHAFLPEDVPLLLRDTVSDREVTPREPVSKAQDNDRRRFESADPGRVMCPTGQLFAFRRSDFNIIGGFDEGLLSFYEESMFHTSMAAVCKKIGVQLNWPFVWHRWSATFGENPELRAGERMAASRARYREKWGVPDGVHEFAYTHGKYMPPIGDAPVRFLRPGRVPAEIVLPAEKPPEKPLTE
jgi:GT2 family glycosyltransferase